MKNNNMFNVEEVAEYLGITPDTVYRKARTGEIPGVRIGRIWRFPKDVIDDWLRAKVNETKLNQSGRQGDIGIK